MKYPHTAPLRRTSEELVPGNARSRVVLSSAGTRWSDILLEQHRFLSSEMADLTYQRHLLVINIGHSTTWEFKKAGRFQSFFKQRSAISLFPSHQPFSGRLNVESRVSADILLFVPVDGFLKCSSVWPEVDSGRILHGVQARNYHARNNH